MTSRTSPWSADEQSALLTALRAGHPPTEICRSSGRSAAEVCAHLSLLLGDAPAPPSSHPSADLDLLWLRVRAAPPAPAALTPADVADLWEESTRITLSEAHRTEFARDPALPGLIEAGRAALLTTARQVIGTTGMLDLGDWLEAAGHHDPTTLRPPSPDRPDWLPRARRLLEVVVADVVPSEPRAALRRRLGLQGDDGRTEATTMPTPPHRLERRGIVEVARAAGLATRPAALLRDALAPDRAVATLARSLGGGEFAVTRTLALFGGRGDAEALRLAGALTSPWHTPPNLGRGAVVRLPER